MNCATVKTLLSEFVDERLDASTAWQVQTHLAECVACAQVSRDFEMIRGALQALPARQPSANFDTALAQRLALTRRSVQKPTWRDKVRLVFPRPSLFLRPAFALGIAASSIAAIVFLPIHLTPPVPAQTTPAADHAFVADCVAQHRRDAAGEPLADVAAQNLAGHFDNTAPASDLPATASGDSEVF
jgi:anti-sigma factor RsiW